MMMMISLDKIIPGSTVKVRKINGEGGLRRRILALGLIPGRSLQVVKVAPLGDPIEVKLNQSNLVIRRSEAQFIEVSGGGHE
jgi:Fe2+ transport system protein FeoA